MSVGAIALLRRGFAEAAQRPAGQPLRLAVIGSKFEVGCEMQRLTDCFLVGYPFDGEWHEPPIQVVSMYVDQPVRRAAAGPNDFALAMMGKARPMVQAGHRQDAAPTKERAATPPVPQPATNEDLSQERAKEFGFAVYRSIPETLRCGGGEIAVDAVLCVVEPDAYGLNELRQELLPKYDFFAQCAELFRTEKKAVPYVSHGDLGFSRYEAQRWVRVAAELRVPLMAGTSMPYADRLPEIALPQGAVIKEAVMVGVGDLNGMAYDALEAMQTLLEQRKGGQAGVRTVQVLEGDAVWEAQDRGQWPGDLLSSALSRSDTPLGLSLLDGRPQDLAAPGLLPQLVKDPMAICLEYKDGLRATLLLLNGAIRDFNLAVRVDRAGILANQFLLTPPPEATHTAHLAAAMEQFFLSGRSSPALARNELCTSVLQASFVSRQQSGRVVALQVV